MNRVTKATVILSMSLILMGIVIGFVSICIGDKSIFTTISMPLIYVAGALLVPYFLCESLIAEKTTTMTQYDVCDIWEKDSQVFITYWVNNKEIVKVFPRSKTSVCEVLETDERYGTCEEWEYVSTWLIFKTSFVHYKLFV